MRFVLCLLAMLVSNMGLARSYWTPTFSEEAGIGHCRYGYVMTGVACTGDHCDKLSLHCTQVGDTKGVKWSDWFSEEHDGERNDDYHVIAIRCKGRYCDKKSLQFAKVDDQRKRGRCHKTSWTTDGRAPIQCEDGATVSGMECDDDYCDDVRLICCAID